MQGVALPANGSGGGDDGGEIESIGFLVVGTKTVKWALKSCRNGITESQVCEPMEYSSIYIDVLIKSPYSTAIGMILFRAPYRMPISVCATPQSMGCTKRRERLESRQSPPSSPPDQHEEAIFSLSISKPPARRS